MKSADKRYIPHKIQDYDEKKANFDDLFEEVLRVLVSDVNIFCKRISNKEVKAICSIQSKSQIDSAMFDGSGGYFVAYIRLLRLMINIRSLDDIQRMKYTEILKNIKGLNMLDENDTLLFIEGLYRTLANLTNPKEVNDPSKKVMISYYFGDTGYYNEACHYNYHKGDFIGFKTNLQALLTYHKYIMDNYKLNLFYYEILYGVAGYLYCLLDLQRHYQHDGVDLKFKVNLENEVYDLTKLIVEEGLRKWGKLDLDNLPKDFRLNYTFHGREYIGGAHGLFGVLYILLQSYNLNQSYFETKNKDFKKCLIITIKASLNTLLGQQLPSGNFPSSFGKASDHLVQFCHGAAGAMQCLCIAAQIFKNDLFGKSCMDAAIKAGENIWKCGILKKGYGLCHGISGNGYAMLTLYRATRDKKWLYRSIQFTLAKTNRDIMQEIENYEFEDRFVMGKSDYPYSLMLGLSGDICYESDLLFAENARFPGYEI